MKEKYKERIKLFICITFTLALTFVCIRVSQVECDLVSPAKATVTGLIACVYMAVAVYTYRRLEKDEELY